MMKLNSQEAFNKTLYNQLNDIADKIQNGISVDNIEFFDETLINALKVTSAEGSSSIVYGDDSTINSYQMNTVKQVLRYMGTRKVETITVPFEKHFDDKGGEVSIPIPKGYSGYNSFVTLDYVKSLDATPDLNLVVTSGGSQDPVIRLWNFKDIESRG